MTTRARDLLLVVPLAALMVGAGIAHFTADDDFASIVPAALPAPHAIVYVTGVMEVLFGLGLLVERSRRLTALALIAFFVAVFPSNINMAVNRIPAFGASTDPLVLYGRLPFQFVLIGWAWVIARRSQLDSEPPTHDAPGA